jgi:uncharacterized protein YndB with AHSA1/START domain
MVDDVLRYIGAVTRELRNGERDGRPARTVIATCSYDSDIDDVWDAITNADRIPRWFLPISGDLRLGGRYQLQGNAGGEITACDPPRMLVLTWEFGGQMSWVRVDLETLSDGGTRLRLEHTAQVPEEFWNEFGPGATGVGWDLTLLGLGRHLRGQPAREPSPDHKDFIRRSSEEWCRASVAAGTNEEAARAAAERTTQFYARI